MSDELASAAPTVVPARSVPAERIRRLLLVSAEQMPCPVLRLPRFGLPATQLAPAPNASAPTLSGGQQTRGGWKGRDEER